MTRFSLSESCQLLAIDPKTLRQWLAQAQISLHPHPKDARIKCLTGEQVQVLARLHSRVLAEPIEGLVPASASARSKEVPDGMDIPGTDLWASLAHLEAQVTTLQAQLTDLALQLRKRTGAAHRAASPRTRSSAFQSWRASASIVIMLALVRASSAFGCSPFLQEANSSHPPH